ncbi:hypothetical protein CHS0354_006119 [Potamilus streckersoni]|uniref:Dedicator of cytokinesis protein 1 n=1 Tax=Potamilus streckersoni TaxID=2493646 RepID=A0AAE0STJ0_9BIVA|nr:hypothetical protein CHS0354_006119 [Potamilus streckersoni]
MIMATWRKTDNNSRYGVAFYNFRKKGNSMLQLDIGDSVQIFEESDDWYRGYATKNKAKKGLFPKTYIHAKEANVSKYGSLEMATPKEPAIAQEIVSVVREWHTYWKQYYVQNHEDFETVRQMILDLVGWRKEVLSRHMTTEEMRVLKQKVSLKIDTGNNLLGLDLVVRDSDGNVLNPDTASAITLYREHVEVADRLKREKQIVDTSVSNKADDSRTVNLYLMLRNFVCRVDDADILVSLYDAKDGVFICEHYNVRWDRERLAKDPEILNNIRVVFTDLGSKDRRREKVFLVFQIIRRGVMELKLSEDRRQTKNLRRPFGAAAMDVTEIIRGEGDNNEEQQHFIPFQQCGEKEFMESVIRKVVSARDINHKGQGVWVSLKLLPGDIKQIREDFPHLVNLNTCIVRKMGFPEVIMPGDVRNDIYVTLMEGEFNKGPTKTSDRNVEVTMVVCNQKGEVIPNVINTGCGSGEGESSYKSLIYYHEDKPKWFEIAKVSLSTEVEFKGLHLKFLFKHKSTSDAKDKSEKPFAMSFVKLMNKNGTTLKDEEHELLVYKIDSKKLDQSSSHPYIDLPSTTKELMSPEQGPKMMQTTGTQKTQMPKIQLFSGPYTLSNRDSFTISTFVCSTKLTHNLDLLGLLKWQEIMNDTTALKKHLENLMKVDGEEIVKFLQDLLDSLFYILMQHTISDYYDNLVFDALVYIIGLVSDRKYHQFRPVINAYIMNNFSFATAYNKLMLILKDYVDSADDSQHEGSLHTAMKSLEYIFKFIIKSRELFAVLNADRGKQQFEITLRQLIQAIGGMMLYQTNQTARAQGYALKNMPATIPDIIKVMNPVEFSQLFVEFLDHVPKNRLRIQKLKCVDDLVQSELFRIPECREVLLPTMLSYTRELLDLSEEVQSCIQVLSNIMDTLFAPARRMYHDSDISTVMDIILRTVIKATINALSGDCVAVLLSILRQMTESHYNLYINKFPTLPELEEFLMEIMLLFQNLIKTNVFNPDWMEMIMLQNSVILRAQRFFAHTIQNKFFNPFQHQLWSNFFHCAISFLTQKDLQLEQFSAIKRNKIINRYKDMRREAGFEIRSLWFSLGPNKIYFIPELVGPLLEMSLIPETELRKATIPIFFDMMMVEYNQTASHRGQGGGNFKQVENEIINQLDVLVEGGQGDEQYMQLLREILQQSCHGASQIREQGLTFVETITKLLQRLLEHRHIVQLDIKDHRMSCIVNLLEFYSEIGRQEMYIRYLHKLCDMHLACDNYTEAAHTLMLYANLLGWKDEALSPILHSTKFPDARTHRDLKEMFYHHIISYFEKGKMWERGIQLCKELADVYENDQFDYEKLSWILQRQAELYRCIIHDMRPDPEYFRVGYFGLGFPSFLQNKVFIYRGKEYERLQDFNARMQSLFPNAELMKTLAHPSKDIQESQKQYLQINAVTPVMEMQPRFLNKQISEKILKYYNFNEVQLFTYSRPIDEGKGDLTTMWLERTNIFISSPLPGILCWFPARETIIFRVSPIEVAIETQESKNKQLLTTVEQHLLDSNLQINELGRLLSGIVDAAVQGGVKNWKSFFSEDYGQSDRDEELVFKLKDLTREQAHLLKDALHIHGKKIMEDAKLETLKPFQAHLEKRFEEWVNLVESEYKLKVKDRLSNVVANSTLKRLQSSSTISLNRISELFHGNSTLEISSHTVSGSPTQTKSPLRAQSTLVKSDKGDKSPVSTKGPQKLTPRRPPRPDTEKRNSRPLSSTFKGDNLSLASTENGDSDHSTDEPPPLPDKLYPTDRDAPPIPSRTSSLAVPKTPRKPKSMRIVSIFTRMTYKD